MLGRGLSKRTPTCRQDRHQLALVMQLLSHNIGCANQTKPVGNWDGTLYCSPC